MRVKYTGAACQDAGNRNNEDTYLVREFKGSDRRIFFYAVADGVGGLGNGDLASGFIIDQLSSWFDAKKEWLGQNLSSSDITMSLYDVIIDIHNALKLICQKKEISCASTLTCAMILKDEYIILQVGDSRAYLYENSVCRQLTKDQTRAQQERDKGTSETLITPKMERTVLQSVGVGKIRPEVFTGKLQVEFQMILCSDGLSNLLGEKDFALCCSRKDLLGEEKLQEMIQLARNRGEKDNITGIHLERCRAEEVH